MYNDDFFEEDVFEEEEVLDDETQSDYDDTEYVLELMQYGVDRCEEAVEALEKLIDINALLGGVEVTGIAPELLNNFKAMFEKFVPDLIIGNNLERMIDSVKSTLNTNETIARDYIDSKRTMALEAIDNNRNK